MRASRRFGIFSAVLTLLLATLACGLPSTPFQSGSGSRQQPAPTTTALPSAPPILATESPLPEPTRNPNAGAVPTADPNATLPEPTRDPNAGPISSPTPGQAATPTTAPTETLPAPTQDIEAQIRAANVLVYEDMAGNFDRKPIVRQAVSEMGFSGGRVVQVNDALGKFKEELLNSAKWDLIVVAAEYRSSVQGEFWKYVYDQVNRGAAVIIEVWYLDQHYTDIQPLLSKCGVEYQADWPRNNSYNINNYAIYWLQPEHPFFQSPQEPASLANVNYLYWVPPLTNDAGDLLELSSGGDAVLLAGTQPDSSSSYGVLATCLNGTMIVQTYSSHDYKPAEVVKLWENSIRYTLTNHFSLKQK